MILGGLTVRTTGGVLLSDGMIFRQSGTRDIHLYRAQPQQPGENVHTRKIIPDTRWEVRPADVGVPVGRLQPEAHVAGEVRHAGSHLGVFVVAEIQNPVF